MLVVVAFERDGEVLHGCLRDRLGHRGQAVALRCLHKALSHAIILRAAYLRRKWLHAEV